MGTSASNSGPRDKTHLLPSWAQGASAVGAGASPPSDAPATAATEPPGFTGESPGEGGSGNLTQLLASAVSDPITTANEGTRGPWTRARRAMTSVAIGGGGARQFRTAGRGYVSAKGGASKSAASATSGRATTAKLGGFLTDVIARGFTEAARSLGIERVVGQKVDVVLAAVINAIAPSGANNDDAVARRAASETLRELFEKRGIEQSGIEALNAMTQADVAETVEISVSAYIYQRWLFDLSQKIEEHAVSESQAVRLERDVKAFVKGLVKLKLDGDRAFHVDWKGAEGKAFVGEIYEAAYRLLGGGI